MLVLCQVSCGEVSVAKVDNPGPSDNPELSYKGLMITHGTYKRLSARKDIDIEVPNYTCLEADQSIEFTTKEAKRNIFKVFLKVSYDFGDFNESEDPDFFIPDERLSTMEKVCFFYGYFSQDFNGVERNFDFYVNFLTSGAEIKVKNLLFLHFMFDKRMMMYKLFNNDPVITEGAIFEDQIKVFNRHEASLASCPKLESSPSSTSFSLNDQKFSFSENGIFEMAFVDKGYNLESIDITNREAFDKYASKRFPELSCKDVSVVIKYPMNSLADQEIPRNIIL